MYSRISYLDGHRGLAILLVLFFHAYTRWPEVVPYGSQYVDIPIFKFGWIGVQLFFLISGFVILMTLEKCADIRAFIYRRWIRLFPAMLFCSILIFITSSYFYERPAGKPLIDSLLPGLTFIEPSWWRIMIGVPSNPLEGSFWSLYVEFKFYCFAACIYFWKGRNWMLTALVFAYVSSIFFKVANIYIPGEFFLLTNKVLQTLSFEHFGWFVAGAAFYIYSKTMDLKWFLIAIFLSILSAVFVRDLEWKPALAACLISAFFAISLISPRLQRILSNRFLQFFGFISYPLYLIHENMMISMIVKLGHGTIQLPQFMYPLLAIIALSSIAFFIARYAETYVKQLIINCGRLMAQTE